MWLFIVHSHNGVCAFQCKNVPGAPPEGLNLAAKPGRVGIQGWHGARISLAESTHGSNVLKYGSIASTTDGPDMVTISFIYYSVTTRNESNVHNSESTSS